MLVRKPLVLGVTLVFAGATVAHARTLDRASASGDYAIAQATGDVDNPSTIRVKVKASPRQRVSVHWTMVCTRGMGAGSKSGSFKARTPVSRKLRKPMGNPDNCIVSANAQLDGSGRVTVSLHG